MMAVGYPQIGKPHIDVWSATLQLSAWGQYSPVSLVLNTAKCLVMVQYIYIYICSNPPAILNDFLV